MHSPKAARSMPELRLQAMEVLRNLAARASYASGMYLQESTNLRNAGLAVTRNDLREMLTTDLNSSVDNLYCSTAELEAVSNNLDSSDLFGSTSQTARNAIQNFLETCMSPTSLCSPQEVVDCFILIGKDMSVLSVRADALTGMF